ncbi:hypothetical protein TrVE_jg3309 [Triparma verrucosa]|uniref:Uncharacterized protein n=1 Tax=Triparma verrucosa TaxID=1606542 RepID=A0A9W7FF68_9STRA|nr:hypothetical protein TrVE_jg3309 [Triparma verrucosa]
MKLKTVPQSENIAPSSANKMDKTMDIGEMKKAMPLGNSPLMNSKSSKSSKSKGSKRKAESKKESKSKSSKTSKSASSSSSSFAYPSTSMPPPSLVKSIYEATGETGKVKIDQVIASICQNENSELKEFQAAVQKTGDESAKDAIQRARVAVKDIEQKALTALKSARSEFEETEKAAKSNNPTNKALWAETATLMSQVSLLKAEEKQWLAQLDAITRREQNLANVTLEEQANLPEDLEVNPTAHALINSILPSCNGKIQKSVEDMTLCADRVALVLKGVNKLVEEADSVKRDIYEGYVGSGRMFQGYDIEDPKRIIGGLLK